MGKRLVKSLKKYAVPAFICLFFGCAGCGRKTVHLVFKHDTSGFSLDVKSETLDFEVKVKDEFRISRLEKLTYPDGNFTMAMTAPLAFAVDGHEFLLIEGRLECGSEDYGPVSNGQSVVINRKGVFIDGEFRGAFPP